MPINVKKAKDQHALYVVSDEFVLDKPYRMISGQGDQAKHVYKQSPDGRWFYPANSDEPGAYIYHDPRDPKSQGFAGSTLTFELEDGTKVPVKGPWHSNSDALFQHTGIDLRAKHKTWGLVARVRDYIKSNNLSNYCFKDVFHLDEQPIVGEYDRINKIAQDMANKLGETVYYYSESRGGSGCGPVNPEKKDNHADKC